MNRKVDNIALYITAVIPLIIIFILAYLMWPRVPVRIHSFEVYEAVGGDRETKSNTVRAGNDIEFDIAFTKVIDAPAEVSVLLKQVRNGYLYPYDRISTTRMSLGNRHFKSAINIPRATPPGTYVLIRSYRYLINPLNHPVITVTSNEFEVKGKTPDPIAIIEEGNLISLQNQKRLDKIEREMMKK